MPEDCSWTFNGSVLNRNVIQTPKRHSANALSGWPLTAASRAIPILGVQPPHYPVWFRFFTYMASAHSWADYTPPRGTYGCPSPSPYGSDSHSPPASTACRDHRAVSNLPPRYPYQSGLGFHRATLRLRYLRCFNSRRTLRLSRRSYAASASRRSHSAITKIRTSRPLVATYTGARLTRRMGNAKLVTAYGGQSGDFKAAAHGLPQPFRFPCRIRVGTQRGRFTSPGDPAAVRFDNSIQCQASHLADALPPRYGSNEPRPKGGDIAASHTA
ncbi:MAG: hypothetical protein GAK35_02634 [Herbaspirillum frisingense]|uniref:Uncharacterized protein n=1 Tax=Herbaspirillum frisingense TaxID=92645 RepID=A0A7V8JU13_9BURK|nr:MAG: hypothetical protein GAK35_02634 [Herbaspirillum frisingense]